MEKRIAMRMMQRRMKALPTLTLARLLFVAGMFFATTANAHFLLNLNVRILHVERLETGLRVYLRSPMPYLVADKVGPVGPNGLPESAPFTSNTMDDGTLTHFVDFSQLDADPLGLGRIVESGFDFVTDGDRMTGKVEQVRLYRVGTEPAFATLDEARVSFAADGQALDRSAPLYVGDTVVDVVLRYNTDRPVRSYAVSSNLNPDLPGQENTANLILDYGPGNPRVFRSRGLMQDPVVISHSVFSAIRTFIIEGVRHILKGTDHVLFVVSLVLGATFLGSLLWRVTGFTLGHSVTLALGFFGFVPSGAWFVPTVETGIALSIIYAAAIAIWPQLAGSAGERRTFVVTCGIGLLHGLGFSFVLQNILQVTSPNIWQSLLAFNVGVEIGQIGIVLATWPLFYLIRKTNLKAWHFVRFGVASVCIGIATIWTVQRFASIITSFS